MNIKIIKLSTFFLMFFLVLTSCNKDKEMDQLVNPDNTETQTTFNSFNGMVASTSSASTTTDSTICYDVQFPLTFILEDGTTVTAQSEDDIESIFDSEPYPVDWEYPINLVDPETGDMVMANNEEDLANYLIGCDWEEWEEEYEEEGEHPPCDSIALGFIDCYEIVYPFDFVLEDGSTVTVQNESELPGIVFSNNPPENFAYPIELINENGETQIVNSEEDLEELLEECEEYDEEEEYEDEGIVYVLSLVSVDLGIPEVEPCYSYVYPISIIDSAGEQLSANSDAELFNLVENNELLEDFVYPLNVVRLADGVTLTINDEEAAWDLIEDCLP